MAGQVFLDILTQATGAFRVTNNTNPPKICSCDWLLPYPICHLSPLTSAFALQKCFHNGHTVSLKSMTDYLYHATLKSATYNVIPSVQKFAFECPSVRPSVSASFQLSARCNFQPIFFKLGIRVDIEKMCLWIADG